MKIRCNGNATKSEQTGSPDKYPQKKFKDKPCKACATKFSPRSPSEMYCDDDCKDKASTGAYFMRVYGITFDDYQKMHDAQGARCAICLGEGFVMDKEKHRLKLVVDHCHSTGKVRGLLCHNCNRALGLFKDSQDALLNAVGYLKV